MAIYTKTELARMVRVCLDQNATSEALLADGDLDTLTLDEIIESKLVEAVARVHSAAPIGMLENGHPIMGEGGATEAGIYWGSGTFDNCGYIILPSDFMRLLSFQMSDWEQCVYTPIAPEDAEYQLQRQRVKALRGTPQRPVVAIVSRGEGKALEFYSCKSQGAYVSRGTYLPYPEVDRSGGIDISPRCIAPVVYTAAALVLTTLGAADKSAAMTQAAETYLQ